MLDKSTRGFRQIPATLGLLLVAQAAIAGSVLDYMRDYDLNDYSLGLYFSGEQNLYAGAKDSGIAKALADQTGLNLLLNDATKAQYDKLTEIGKGQLDKSAISELTFKGRNDS